MVGGVSDRVVNQVAIGYSLYRGSEMITWSRAVELAGPAPKVEHLRVKVCDQRNLNADTALVFGSEADLLAGNKDKAVRKEKVSLSVCSLCLSLGSLLLYAGAQGFPAT